MLDPIADLARAMTARGLSQSELARRAGVSRAGLNRILKHKQDPYLSVYVRLMRAARGAGGVKKPATIGRVASEGVDPTNGPSA